VHIHTARAWWRSSQRIGVGADVQNPTVRCDDGLSAWVTVIGRIHVATDKHDGLGTAAGASRPGQKYQGQ